MLPHGPVPNDWSITLQLDLFQQLKQPVQNRRHTCFPVDKIHKFPQGMNTGQEHKEVCLTMVKMSENRKCQIPKGKNKRKLWLELRHQFFCGMKLYSAISPKEKQLLKVIKVWCLVNFLCFKVQNKSKSNNTAFMPLLAGNLTLHRITFLQKNLTPEMKSYRFLGFSS